MRLNTKNLVNQKFLLGSAKRIELSVLIVKSLVSMLYPFMHYSKISG